MTTGTVRSKFPGHSADGGRGKVLASGLKDKVFGVHTPPMEAARPTETFARLRGPIVAGVSDLAFRLAEHPTVRVDDTPIDTNPAVAVRLDVIGRPEDARGHTPNSTLWGRVDGETLLPNFGEMGWI